MTLRSSSSTIWRWVNAEMVSRPSVPLILSATALVPMPRSPTKIISFIRIGAAIGRSSQAPWTASDDSPAKTSTPTGQPSALQSKAIYDLFVTSLAIAIIAEGDDVALGVGSFKVAAGNVVEHQVTILEMTSCQVRWIALWRSWSRSSGR